MNASSQSLSLQGQVALITGGGRGIGAATAEALARKGVHVVVASRTEAELVATVARLRMAGSSASSRVFDVADEAAVNAAFAAITAEFGRLDILVNNAAILLSGPFADMAMADWDRVLAVNLRGAVLCARQAFRWMRDRGGAIVNVSSLGGGAGDREVSRLRRLHGQQIRLDRLDRGAGRRGQGTPHPGQRRRAGGGGHGHAAPGRAAFAHPHRPRRRGQGHRLPVRFGRIRLHDRRDPDDQ